MERNSKLIVCPLSEERQRFLNIDETTTFDAWFQEGELCIRIVDEEDFKDIYADDMWDREQEANRVIGQLTEQLEGYKEGYRDGYRDGLEEKKQRDNYPNKCNAERSTDAE
jgi:flagellar biosynthesis/type III secretory pathway protein FliH